MKNLSFKTVLGAIIVAGSAVCRYLGYDDLGNIILTIGAALTAIGIGHKLDKVKNALR